jgi:DNA-binding response OmpR family regulator
MDDNAAPNTAGGPDKFDGKKIFIVEDDRFLSSLLVRKLSTTKMDVQNFENGEDAVDALKKTIPDLVILDLLLPRMNGFEVLEFIRKDERLKNVPVMVVTNTDQLEDRARIKKLGAEFITKAVVSPDMILEYAKQVLEHGRIIDNIDEIYK